MNEKERGGGFSQAELVAAFQEAAAKFKPASSGENDPPGALTAEEWTQAIHARTGQRWSTRRFISAFKRLQAEGLAELAWVQRERVDTVPITKVAYRMIPHPDDPARAQVDELARRMLTTDSES